MLFSLSQRLLNIRFWLLILVGLLCVGAAARSVVGQEVEAESGPTAQSVQIPTIFNGSQATPGEFPWMVAFRFFNYYYPGTDCGGALIDPQWILTAAHCFYDFDGNYSGDGFMDIRIGEHDLASNEGTEVLLSRSDVETIYLHPDYDNDNLSSPSDIALLKLKTPVTLSNRVGLISPAGPAQQGLEADGATATVAGWGYTSNGGGATGSDLLRKATYSVQIKNGCGLGDDNLCMDTANTLGSCLGDSGSPLFAQDAGDGWQQLGIVASGPNQCGTGTDIYTRVSHHRNWIRSTSGLPLCPSGGVIYVDKDAPGGGDGLSWGTAYNILQDALAVTDACQIWVAEGAYRPTANPSEREATFSVPPGVSLYGGFVGIETDLDQRDWKAHPTILSGDLDDNDDVNNNGIIDLGEEPTGENSYNVLTLDGTTRPIDSSVVIDGFTISGGLADSTTISNSGAGLYCNAQSGGECTPLLRNLIFIGNKAVNGGAILNYGLGGGIASPRIDGVVFRQNVATDKGGAVFNLALGEGSEAGPSMSEVIFTDNRSTGTASFSGGGAIYNYYYGASGAQSIVNGLFLRNSATKDGGTIYNRAFESSFYPSFTHVTMVDNSADQGGGIYYLADELSELIPAMQNSILWNNTAGTAGPQIYVDGSVSSLSLSYSLVKGGDAGIHGSTAFSDNDGNIDADPRFQGADKRLGTGSPAIDAASAYASNADLDLDGNIRPIDNPSTPDTGVGSGPIPDMGAYEFDSLPCPTANKLYVDQDATAGSNTGDNWPNAFRSVHRAFTIAEACANITEIWVAEGVYSGTDVDDELRMPTGLALYGGFDGSESTLAERDWVKNPTILSGDVDGDDTNTDGNFIAERTDQIKGTNSRVLSLTTSSGPITESTRIDGFTITAGWAGGDAGSNGGGLLLEGYSSFSPVLANLTFSGNYAAGSGGGINLYHIGDGSLLTLSGITFLGNQALDSGGAVYFYSGGSMTVSLMDASFATNQADSGGGLYVAYSGTTNHLTLSRNTFTDNSATNDGGALRLSVGSADSVDITADQVSFENNSAKRGGAVYAASESSSDDGNVPSKWTNVLFWKNVALTDGGAMYIGGVNPNRRTTRLTNATLVNNSAAQKGGALFVTASGSLAVDVDNTILWGNTNAGGSNQIHNASPENATITLDRALVQDGATGVIGGSSAFANGTGNLSADPQFTAPAAGNFSVRPDSPAINAGDNAAISGFSTDLTGNPRIFESRVDMGAYESQVLFAVSTSTVTPTPTATGTSTPLPKASSTPTPTSTSTSTPTAGGATATPTMTPTATATSTTDTTTDTEQAIYLPLIMR